MRLIPFSEEALSDLDYVLVPVKAILFSRACRQISAILFVLSSLAAQQVLPSDGTQNRETK